MDTRASCYGVEVGRSREPWKFGREGEEERGRGGEREESITIKVIM